jgi:hypothetical protein
VIFIKINVKDVVLYFVIAVLALLFFMQLSQKGQLIKNNGEFGFYLNQLHKLSGIGQLRSTHEHADVKVYLNNNPIDFSQGKYQVTTSFIHFEDGKGGVIHTHATGLSMRHLFNSMDMKFTNDCFTFDGHDFCNDDKFTLKLYVNGELNHEYGDRIIKDYDKYLITYGDESEEVIQEQLSSITDFAPDYSGLKPNQ